MINFDSADSSERTAKVSSLRRDGEFRTRGSFKPQPTVDLSNGSLKDKSSSAEDTSSMVKYTVVSYVLFIDDWL